MRDVALYIIDEKSTCAQGHCCFTDGRHSGGLTPVAWHDMDMYNMDMQHV